MRRVVLAGLALCMAAGAAAAAQDRLSPVQGPVAWWPLDTAEAGTSPGRAGGHRDRIEGLHRVALGVVGQAIVFDGYTTVLRRTAATAPLVSSAFTVEAWLALGAYPWNVVPVVDHGDERMRGYVFGLGPRGELSLKVAVDGRWLETRSPDGAVPLRRWTHVAARYDVASGLSLFVNGMTDRPWSDLLDLARSWSQAPELRVAAGRVRSLGYDRSERVYRLKAEAAVDRPLEFGVAASPTSPIRNLALVVEGWGDASARLTLDGRKVSRGPGFRYGHRHTLAGTDLVVWIETRADTSLRIRLSPGEARDK